MERGLYAAASGMLAQQTIQDTLAQNIANVATVGYKQDNATFRTMQGMALRRLTDGHGRGPKIGELGMGVQNDQVYTDWQTGPLTSTKNPLDASLGTNQFFAVNTRNGERYTRAGDLQIDGSGRLVTAAGQAVLAAGTNQPIVVPPTLSNFALDPNGNLTAGGQTVARLKIVEADPTQLVKEGDTLFNTKNPATVRPSARPTVRPGTLEQSNMNVVQGLVRMISTTRSFEMAQKALLTQDELLKQASTEIGKV